MTTEIQTVIYTQEGVRIALDQWDDNGLWLSLQGHGASMFTTLNRAEAEELLANLQAVLAQEVTA